MAGKRNNGEHKDDDKFDEIIERLNPHSSVSEKIDDGSIDHLFADEPKRADKNLDRLFNEERQLLPKELQDQVQKALSQPEMSKAKLFRMRSSEPNKKAFEEEIATLKSVEEIWDEKNEGAGKTLNRKSLLVMYGFISLLIAMIAWAVIATINDKRGNEEKLNAQMREASEREQLQISLNYEIQKVTEVVDRFLTAKTVPQKSESIYDAETLQSEIESYYERVGGVMPITEYFIEQIIPIHLDGENLWEVYVKMNDVDNKPKKIFYVRENSKGEYKVDWAADVALQKHDVKKFKATRSREVTSIKFIVEKLSGQSIYNWSFHEANYDVQKLIVPNSDIIFWGYVRRGSPEELKIKQSIESDLKNNLWNRSVSHQFILKVRFLEDAPRENDQYILIDDIVSRKWVEAEK